MQDRRNCRRGLTYLGGRVSFNNRLSTLDCLVRNMSQNGAKLIFAVPVSLPTEFDIQIHNKGDSRRARIIWRNETEIGIVMLETDTGTVVSIETARQIRKLEADRDTSPNVSLNSSSLYQV